ncbi:MAG TPA: hypothetical protein QGF05_05610, partial [Dehalococcoidia bacterium]|nr:hypothetical protein [Dehalococcoidia bacterium]
MQNADYRERLDQISDVAHLDAWARLFLADELCGSERSWGLKDLHRRLKQLPEVALVESAQRRLSPDLPRRVRFRARLRDLADPYQEA